MPKTYQQHLTHDQAHDIVSWLYDCDMILIGHGRNVGDRLASLMHCYVEGHTPQHAVKTTLDAIERRKALRKGKA